MLSRYEKIILQRCPQQRNFWPAGKFRRNFGNNYGHTCVLSVSCVPRGTESTGRTPYFYCPCLLPLRAKPRVLYRPTGRLILYEQSSKSESLKGFESDRSRQVLTDDILTACVLLKTPAEIAAHRAFESCVGRIVLRAPQDALKYSWFSRLVLRLWISQGRAIDPRISCSIPVC